MLKRICCVGMLVLAVAGSARVRAESTEGVSTLRANLVAWYAKDAPSAATIEHYRETLGPTGAWPDVDYADKTRGGWKAYEHLGRMLTMAQAYAQAGHPLAGSPGLRADVAKALTHWLDGNYQNPNWWYPQIGVPLAAGPTLVLMGDGLPVELRARAIAQLLGPSKMGMTGQNRLWLAGIALIKGVLTDDRAVIGQAKAQIFAELAVTTKEGLQPDYSFHQHGPQQQWGNYGLAFSGDMVQWAGIFSGTDDALAAEQMDLLFRYLTEGTAWILWKGRMDISGCGRQIFKDCQAGKGRSVLRQLRSLAAIGSPQTDAYRNIMSSNTPDAQNTFVGNKHFWRSDMTVHRRPGWYASVKMSSTRVIGAETCNSENLLGLHLGDGVTYYLRTGTEYEDLFPVWDWHRLPGTTCRQDAKSLVPSGKQCLGRSDFAGGVSDGVRGVAAMVYLRDGLEARKAWFFLDDVVVCLGAGITSEPAGPVVTSVNQCHFRDSVAVGRGQRVTVLGQGGRSNGPLNWVHHDGMGYVFLDPQEVTVGVQNQSGDWRRVHERYSDRQVQADVFNLWIDHRERPEDNGYAYAVFPDVAREDMPGLYESPPVKVLEQNASLLAVSSREGRRIQAVFFEPGRLTWGRDRFIEVSAPCVMMLDLKGSLESLHLADPTHKLQTLDVRFSEGYTAAVTLPRDGLAGQTVGLEFQHGQ